MSKGDQLKWQSARFAFERHRDRYPDSPISFSLQLFSLPISTQVCCAKQKRLENRNNVQGGLAQVVEPSIRIREAPGSIPDSPISFSLQLFSLPIATQVFCAKQKRLENRTNVQGGLARVEISSTLWQSQTARFAFAQRHRDRDTDTPIGYSLQLFSLPISTQVCCAKQKRLKNRNNIYRGISSSGRALDSHSRGTAIETPILQLVIHYNYFRCQLQHKFFVPNRKGWGIEQICKGDQLKWQSARFAFDRHRDGDPDTPIGEFQRKCFVPNRKGWRIENMSKGDQLKQQSARFAFEMHRDRDTILQLVIVYNYFHCQFQRKFVVPNRKGWRIEKMSKGDQIKWQSARFAFERHRDRYPDSPISFSLQLFSLPIATQVFCAKQKRLENRKKVQGRLAQVVERSIRILEAPGSRHG